MSTIYRIEDIKGRGPYRGVCDIQSAFDDEPRHPVPRNDSKLCETASHLFRKDPYGPYGAIFDAPNFVFGYSSIKQLRAWFYKDEPLRILHKNGYSLLHLEGECYHGNSQAIINKTTMKVLSTTSLLTLLSASNRA